MQHWIFFPLPVFLRETFSAPKAGFLKKSQSIYNSHTVDPYIPVQTTPNWIQWSWLILASILLTSIDVKINKRTLNSLGGIFSIKRNYLSKTYSVKIFKTAFVDFAMFYFFCWYFNDWIMSIDLSTFFVTNLKCVRYCTLSSECTLLHDVKLAWNKPSDLYTNIFWILRTFHFTIFLSYIIKNIILLNELKGIKHILKE